MSEVPLYPPNPKPRNSGGDDKSSGGEKRLKGTAKAAADSNAERFFLLLYNSQA